MSKRSKKEPFLSNIDDLFEEIDREVAPQGLTSQANTPGWVWECDMDGTYRSVSPEVETLTGLDPEIFVGQPIASFRVAPESRAQLQAALAGGRFPAHVQIGFLMGDNKYQIVTLHLLSNENGRQGWHGFNEVVGIEFESATTPPKIEPEEPAETLIEDDPLDAMLSSITNELAEELGDTAPHPHPEDDAVEEKEAIETQATLVFDEGEAAEEDETPANSVALVAFEDDTPADLSAYMEPETDLLFDDDTDFMDDEADEVADQLDEVDSLEPGFAGAEEHSAEVDTDSLTFPEETSSAVEDTDEPAIDTDSLALPDEEQTPTRSVRPFLDTGTLDEADDQLREDDAHGDTAADEDISDKPNAVIDTRTLSVDDVEEFEANQEALNRDLLPATERSTRDVLLSRIAKARVDKIDTGPLEELREEAATRQNKELVKQSSADISTIDNSLIAKLKLPEGSAGLLEILDDNPGRKWTQDERILVQQVADQLELALENADLFQQTQGALSETNALYQASAEMNAANEYADVLEILRKYTLVGQNCTLLSVNTFDTPWKDTPPEWFEALNVWDPGDMSRWSHRSRVNALPAYSRLLRRDEITFIEDTLLDERLDDFSREHLQNSFDARSALFIPMNSGGEWVGFINAFFNRKKTFTIPDKRQLSSIASQAIEKIISIQLSKLTSARRANADQLNEVARQFGEILSVDDLRGRLMFEVVDRLHPDDATLYTWDGEQNAFRVDDLVLAEPQHTTGRKVGDLVSRDQRPDLAVVFDNNRSAYEALEWSEDLLREQFLVPWLIGEVRQGVIEVHHTARGLAITSLDQEFVNGLVLQAASSMERARLFEQTQSALALTDEQARRLEVLNRLSNDLGSAQTLEDVYRISIQHTHEIFPSERLSLTLLDDTRRNVEVVEVFETEDALSRLRKGQLIAVQGTANQIAIEEHRVVMESNDTHSSVRSYIIGPLTAGGEVLGTLNIGSQQAFFFREQDTNFMAQLVAVISSAMENRQLFKAIQDSLSSSEEQARRLAELNAMSESLATALSLNEVMSIAARRLKAIVPFDYASFSLLDEEQEHFKVHSINEEGEVQIEFTDFPRRGTLAHQVILDNQLLTVGDLSEYEHSDAALMRERGYRSIMYVPMLASNKVIGTLNLALKEAHVYSLRDESLMVSVGSFLSSTIDNRELLNQIQRRSTQLEATAEVSRVTSQILDTTQLLLRVVELIRDGFNLYYCGLFMVDTDGGWTGEPGKWVVLQAGTGTAGTAMLHEGHKLEIGGNSMIGSAVATKEARIALDVGAEAAFFRNPHLPDTRSEMALPLISRGEVLGALTIQSVDEAAFSPEDVTALQTLADQVANTIQNARLFEETQDRAEELSILNEMARTFTQILDELTVIETTYEFTSRLMNADNFYFALYEADTDMVEYKLFTENGERIAPPQQRVKRGGGVTDWIISRREAVLMPENVEDHLLRMGMEVRGDVSKSYLGVPLLRGEQVLGVMAVQSYTQSRAYGTRERDLLSAVASQVSIALDNARLFLNTQTRARRETLLREITARVHSSSDPEMILKTAVREVSQALGRKAFIQLESEASDGGDGALSDRVMPPGIVSNDVSEGEGQDQPDSE
jgi:GAF domain-containing protein